MGRKDALKRAIESYLLEVKELRSPRTYITYRNTAWRIYKATKVVGITTYLTRWTLQDIITILAERSHLLPSTFRLEATVLRNILNHSEIRIMEDALRKGRLKLPMRSRVNVRWYSEDILAMVRANCLRDVEYIIIVLASELGLRRAEITKILLSDIHGDTLVVRGKGGKMVPIPITQSLRLAMDAWVLSRQNMIKHHLKRHPSSEIPEELIIHANHGGIKAYSPQSITKIVLEIGKRMGIKLCPHDLRRSCGREIYRATGDLIAVNRLLRHESIDQTRDYIGADLEDARRAILAREAKRPSIAPMREMPVIQDDK